MIRMTTPQNEWLQKCCAKSRATQEPSAPEPGSLHKHRNNDVQSVSEVNGTLRALPKQ